jgi:hypothetical protein
VSSILITLVPLLDQLRDILCNARSRPASKGTTQKIKRDQWLRKGGQYRILENKAGTSVNSRRFQSRTWL